MVIICVLTFVAWIFSEALQKQGKTRDNKISGGEAEIGFGARVEDEDIVGGNVNLSGDLPANTEIKGGNATVKSGAQLKKAKVKDGTGKTTTLAKIFYEYKADTQFSAVWLTLSNYSIFHINTKIENFNSLEALKQNLEDFKRLLIDFGEQIDTEIFETLSSKMLTITDDDFENLFKF